MLAVLLAQGAHGSVAVFFAELAVLVAVPPVQSGFLAPRNVSGLTLVNTPKGKAVIVSNSGDSLQAFRIRSLARVPKPD